MVGSTSALETVKRLVAFDTTSCNSNLELIAYAREELEAAGARCRLTHDDARIKANLFASIGPDVPGGYALSGHTDVVPVDGQEWSGDPFAPEVRGTRLYGRGTADMKGFVGVALALAHEMKAAPLKRPIHFAFSYDEEVGCAGVGRMLADIAQAGIRPELAIVGEPTEMRVVGAHKSGAVLKTAITGREGHSSAPHKGANAVMAAGEIAAFLGRLGDELEAARDARFDPPYSTVQANMIVGGTAVNVLARQATLHWEYRVLPHCDADALRERVLGHIETRVLPRLRRGAPEAKIETTLVAAYPGLAADPDSPAVALARELSGGNAVDAVAYGTEAGLFQRAGIPAVVCGPGSIDQAHRADEFVELAQLDACEAFLRRLIARACR